MDNITVKLKFEHETKGAVRFQEIDDKGSPKDNAGGAVLRTLYIRKTAIKGDIPESLTVTIAKG